MQESPVGTLLRDWRQRRRLSQLELALAADSSARHLSCVETGKAQPSRAMVLKLCDVLEVPLRERNTVLLAGGFAPEYRESSLDDAHLAAARAALDTMLTAHEPYPAVAVDRYWNVVAANRAMGLFSNEVDEQLMERPNVYRLALHPGPPEAATHMINHGQVRELLLERLLRQVRATGDPILRALYDEVSQYPLPVPVRRRRSRCRCASPPRRASYACSAPWSPSGHPRMSRSRSWPSNCSIRWTNSPRRRSARSLPQVPESARDRLRWPTESEKVTGVLSACASALEHAVREGDTDARFSCARGDLNPYVLGHWNLNPARLPIPPLARAGTTVQTLPGLTAIMKFPRGVSYPRVTRPGIITIE